MVRYSVGPCCVMLLLGSLCSKGDAGNENVHLTYHWHLHQPIYWPEKHPGQNRYQYAKDSIDLKMSGSGNYYPGSSHKHPRNQLVQGDGGEYDAVFDKDDRKQAYQSGGRNSIDTIRHNHGNAGASVSYSGSLQENIGSLGRANSYGYGPGWSDGFTEARRDWRTVGGGFPRADMVGMTYHHSFSPLLPESVLRKEIQIFKEIWWKSWGGNANKSDHSKGFWPIECAFSRHMIPVLLDEGYEWVIVPNNHLARTCQNYMDVVQRGTSGWNIDPPNRADVLGPTVAAEQWYNGQIDGRGGTFPAPFAYQAHRTQWVNPETGEARSIVAVPMCDLQSYINGFQTMGADQIQDEIGAWAGDSGHPCIVLLAHDGDNAWGGGSSYYFESVPGLMNDAAGRGMHPTTIQQFLNDHPVPAGDLVHIEDGAWVNAANDWGHPQFINWLWPPARPPSDPGYDYDDPRTWVDIQNGFAEDWRNWAVIMAAANYCEMAEQIDLGNGRSVEAWQIQEPYRTDGTYNWPSDTEQAWHYLLGGLDSGFMYYGVSLDDEVKQTLAGNRAIGLAQAAIADNGAGVSDETPPTVFKPQRWPWNPGGMGWGPTTGYRPIGFDGAPPHYTDFYVWTLAFDVSGVVSVALKVRRDLDGVNPLGSTQNETYAGGAEVGGWFSIPMERRVIDPGDNGGNSQIDFFMQPTHIADHYWAKVTSADIAGLGNSLLDYYVEATDTEGNIHKSCIQHVYVYEGDDPGSSVTFSDDPRDCAPLGVTYDASGGPLDGIGPVYMELSFDEGVSWSNSSMTAQGVDTWSTTSGVPNDASSATVWFHNGAGLSDSNNGAYWATAIRDCEDPFGPSSVEFIPEVPSGCDDVTIVYRPNGGVLQVASQVYIHIGRNGWQDVVEPSPAMTAGPSNTWTYTFSPPVGTEMINCVFHNGGSTWDNLEGYDWSVGVTGCDRLPVIIAPGNPIVSDDPVDQNHVTDAFDMSMSGGSATTVDQGGFGSFGQVFANYDETFFYIGGMGCDLSGNNNGMVVFLNFNTLVDDQSNLSAFTGPPFGMDYMHNLTMSPGMDIAVVIGDEWGDGTYTNFDLGNNYNFGQGIYYLSSVSSTFEPVPGARLSQFDGSGTLATQSTDYDGDRLMNRWEAAIPWASLGASDISSITTCQVAAVVASSSVSGETRYLSGNYLGAAASGSMQGGNYGYNAISLTALDVHLPGYDSDGDGLADEWELRYFVNLGFLGVPGDWDGDDVSDVLEQAAGSDPSDPASLLAIVDVMGGGNGPVLRWQSARGRTYAVHRTTNLLEDFSVLESNIPSTPLQNVYTDAPGTVGSSFYLIGVE